MDGQQSSTTWRRRATLAALVLVLVAGLGWAWHWRTHPTAFAADGNETRMRLNPGQDVTYLGVIDASDRDEQVRLESASPRTVRNTADASITLHVCTIDPAAGGGIGVVPAEDVPVFCLAVEPVRGGTTFALDGSQQVIAKVTVRRTGVVRVEGVDLTYRHGWQSGTQTTGLHLSVARD